MDLSRYVGYGHAKFSIADACTGVFFVDYQHLTDLEDGEIKSVATGSKILYWQDEPQHLFDTFGNYFAATNALRPPRPLKEWLVHVERIFHAHRYFLAEARQRLSPLGRAVRQRVAECLAVSEDLVHA